MHGVEQTYLTMAKSFGTLAGQLAAARPLRDIDRFRLARKMEDAIRGLGETHAAAAIVRELIAILNSLPGEN